ncbi:hypothetical protein [Spirosoma montaniterrae]|uniref:Uncharacterized protein n=1 Tax=Spirosoma montaniterrae TaxID=1178516 RepID=A0A1P9WY66_9BACT|nr:hypothetical protein [Spirosoma montaniterrae]AQG80325.1 hypothetical protein AWR27_13955 [Spirosoma montaniterrae]
MYVPGSTDDLIFHEDMAVYGPKDHQRIISKLNARLGPKYYDEKSISLEPLPETMLDEGQASPTPDVILFDNTTKTTPIIIEICHTEGLKKDIRKVIRLVDEDEYGIEEAFVYDYKTEKWLRYRKGDGGLMTESSFSDILNLDLNPLIQ